MTKLISGAKKLDTFFKVLQKIISISMIVVLCVVGALTIANAVNPATVIGTGLNTVDLGPITLELAQEHTPGNSAILGYVWIYVVLGGVCAAVIYLSIGYVRQILQPMTEGRPFHEGTAQCFRKLAVASIVLGVAQNVGRIVETTAALRSFGLNAIMETGVIRAVTANYEMDLTFLLAFFVLMLLSRLFAYGAQLQQLSDETL